MKIHKVTLFLIIIAGSFAGVTGGAFFALFHDLPQIRELEAYKPSATTRVYSADKILLAELFIEKRDPVAFDEIPEALKKALITTEDRSFYRHSGVDLKGIIRAIVKDIMARRFVEGASTITQQLSKTLFLDNKKTIPRKLKEALLALQLERRYTKDEILSLYLNQVYFGSGAYGIKSAAHIFFGKSVHELTLAECALIAGMPKSPSRYSPLVSQEKAIQRRNVVLHQMMTTDIITEEVYKNAIKEPLVLAAHTDAVKAPYFVAYVREILESIVGSSRLYKSGLTVYTTLSYEMQAIAEASVKRRIAEVEERMRLKQIENPDPQCAVIAIDVISGGILSMVGGNSFAESVYNRATMAKRQPGSAFKPIVFAYAIENGYTQNMLILDAPVAFNAPGNGKIWRPENFSKTYMGEITLRKALNFSKNIPAVRLIEKIGPASVVAFAHTLGIRSHLYPYLSLALGSSEMTLLEITAAYSVFPNAGRYIEPFGIIEIQDRNGRPIWRPKPQKTIAMSRAGAAVMVDMLEGIVKEGTGRRARSIGRSVAGKTGTTNEFRDALFIGFSPSVALGVWVGQDAFKSLGKNETGAKAALPIWVDIMKKTLANRPPEYFDIPDDVVKIAIDPSTGKPVSNASSNAVVALFKKGTELDLN